ncbi:Deoxyribonuclease-1-like 1 [Amphibalanus amphitrite]|uniref:Deoxyribonuclease-1-like 1 n=1 Tax=Amphibalanus amphitrite TaxID=1232801 RepID=A0A6A4V9H1_AMPAM|nr:Deoxyribonuclease-1-like 1 [Amphibalanus amphitrite]
MEKPEVMDVLTRVLSGYDIILVQEIVDVSETGHPQPDGAGCTAAAGLQYEVTLSPRVGRGSYEQYGYVYRTDRVSVKAAQLYPDTTDVFAREPYIATFAVSGVRHLDELTLVGIHTQPSAADKEIDALSDVLDYTTAQLGATNDVTWAIADHTDTTVSATNCAYDRVVLRGDALSRALVAGSAAPFRFDAAWGLSEELTESVSDHYPVAFRLKPLAVSAAESYLQALAEFSVTDTRGTPGEQVKALAAAAGSGDTASYTVRPLYDAAGVLSQVQAEYRSYKLSGEAILDTVEVFQTRFPAVVSDYQLGLLRYKLAAGGFADASVFEAASSARWYARVTCPMESSARCWVAVGVRTPVA